MMKRTGKARTARRAFSARLTGFAAIAALCLASAVPSRAEFEDTGIGARPMGMGNAFVGLADDSRAISYNPAGLPNLERSEICGDYSRFMTGLSDKSTLASGFFSVAVPLRFRKGQAERMSSLQKIAGAESKAEVASSTETAPVPAADKKAGEQISFFKDRGTLGLAVNNFNLDDTYTENTIWVSYGKKIFRRMSGGLSLKLLQENYSLDEYTRKDPVFEHGGRSSISKFSVDLGMLMNVAPRLYWGLAAQDINSPNMALNSKDVEKLPASFKSGLAYRDNRMNMAVDLVSRDSEYRVHAGGEKWFKNRMYAMRIGGEFGTRDYKTVTAGGSVNWGNFQIDYAVLYPIGSLQNMFGSHRLSFTYRFGKKMLREMESGSIEYYYSRLQEETEILRARLEKAEDERSRIEKVLVEEALSRIKEKVRAEKLESSISTNRRENLPQAPVQMLRGIPGSEAGTRMKTYVSVKGDTLQSIAETFYGKKDRWVEILNINKDKVGRGGSLKAGTVLLIPGVGSEVKETGGSQQAGTVLAPLGQTLAPIGQTLPPSQGMTILAPIQGTIKPVPAAVKEKVKKSEDEKPAAAKPKTYTVLPGDTLGSIAEKIYGDKGRWKDLYNANKDKVNRGSVDPGTVLTLP